MRTATGQERANKANFYQILAEENNSLNSNKIIKIMLTYPANRMHKVTSQSFNITTNGDAATLNIVVNLSRDTIMLIAIVSNSEKAIKRE